VNNTLSTAADLQDTLDLRVAPMSRVRARARATSSGTAVSSSFCPRGQVPRQTAQPIIISPASARARVARMINIVQPPRRRAAKSHGTTSRRRRGLPHFLGLSQARASPYNIQTVAGAESLLRPKVPATGRHFESLLFSTHIARTSSSKPSQNRVIASAMARSVFATIVSLSTADRLPPRARQETLAPCS
jgi:hypothetical protein